MRHHNIHKELTEQYTKKIQTHGATIEGASWGSDKDRVHARWDMICKVFPFDSGTDKPQRPVLLDMGCSYGGMYGYMKEQGMDVMYNGIDLVDEAIAHAKQAFPEANFTCSDLDSFHPEETFDYVVACGSFAAKGESSHKEMHRYWKNTITKMFDLCRRGIAFNVFTNRVNQFHPESFYVSPAEALLFCFENLSDKVILHHATGLFDYFLYIYR